MHERHGQTSGGQQPRLYRIWVAMRQRCSDPARDNYARYGGRGIRVCDEWDKSFPAFMEWAHANGYTDQLTIDRIDNDANYAPGNCRWISAKQQLNNTHRSCVVEIAGVRKNIKEWSDATGIVFSTLYKRYHRGVRGKALIAPPRPVTKGSSL